jgi:hypothetical protein
VFNDASAFCILRPEVTYTLEQHISELTPCCANSLWTPSKWWLPFKPKTRVARPLGFSKIGCF